MAKYSEEEKAMWVEDWKGSGTNARAYAKANGINPQTFGTWIKGKEKPGFVELQRAACVEAGWAGNEILIETGAVKIHLPCDYPAKAVGEVARSLWRLT
jgi:hypothetical protein